MPNHQANRANLSNQAEVIYQSAPSEPDDDFWLEQSNKLIVESLPVVREAAKSLMTGLGALQGIIWACSTLRNSSPKGRNCG